MTIEDNLKELIIAKYGTMVNFTSKIDIPNSTLAAIISRGVNNASINNIIKICRELDISAEALANGQIVPNNQNKTDFKDVNEIITFAKVAILSNKELTIDGHALDNEQRQTLIDGFELSCEFVRRKAARNEAL